MAYSKKGQKPLKALCSCYPFGLQQKGYNTNVSPNGNALAQQYKFGGKEYQEEFDINTYDFGARNYDPALGRWMNIDPLAENSRRWTPYNFAYNNPIYFVDPDGMQADDWKNKNGDLVYDADKGEYTEHATDQEKEIGEKLRTSGEKGEEQFNNLVNSEHDVVVEFHEEENVLAFGKTLVTLDESGEKIDNVKMDIYMGSVEKAIQNPDDELTRTEAELVKDNNLDVTDLAASVLGHEIPHGTLGNKKLLDKENRTGKIGANNSETIPNKTGLEILKDIAENKKLK